MKKLLCIAFASLSLTACAPMMSLLGGNPVAAPLNSTSIDESAIDFARDSFDAALYGVDALMDIGRIKEGSPEARSLAKIIRQVAGFLGAADAAQKAGQSASYNEAFKNAKVALAQFRSAIGLGKSASLPIEDAVRSMRLTGVSLTDGQRLAFADALDGHN